MAAAMTDHTGNSGQSSEAARRWLETPFGQALLAQEMRLVEEAFDGLFGEYCLQLGLWGEATSFTRFARTQRAGCIADGSTRAAGARASAIGQLHRLPVSSDSVDLVFLPHTLDYCDERCHAILREADRILTPHGQLVILGFKPGGLWGLRRLIPGAGLPPDSGRLIADRKLSDWLKLLDMHIEGITRYFFRWPLRQQAPVFGGLGGARTPLLARTRGLLYAHGPETGGHADPHQETVAQAAQGRRRHRRTNDSRIPNPF